MALVCWKGAAGVIMLRIIKSWPAHNLVAHPLSEILYWIGAGDLGNRLHDMTLPDHVPGTGRG